jgi:TonB family protein
MDTLLANLLPFVALMQLLSVSEPGYPPNAVNGETVVARLQFSPGAPTSVRILTGGGAFADSARSALEDWKFAPDQKGTVIAVVQFRNPNYYSTGPTTRNLEPFRSDALSAYPKSVVDATYPANSLGQGAVIIRLNVDSAGTVSDTEVIRPAGDLTDASLAAVRQWRFYPAKDSNGRSEAANVYAVLVFRMPVNAPLRPPGGSR